MILLSSIINSLTWGPVSGYVVGLFILLAIGLIFYSTSWSLVSRILLGRQVSKAAKTNVSSTILVAFRGLAAIALLTIFFLHPNGLHATSEEHISAGMLSSYYVVVTLLVSYILFILVSRIILFYHGDVTDKEGRKSYEVNNKSRRMTIVSGVIITLGMFIVIVNILHVEDYLQASGFLAVAMAIFGLSQSAWFPDYMHGLVILFSELYKKGDVIVFAEGNETIYAQVFNVKAFHTELITFSDRNRLMIRHSRMRDFTIRNLSRAGGSKGLREQIIYKIGYDVSEADVRKLFDLAFKKIELKESIPIENQHDLEVRMFDAGDHAVWWIVYYHTKNAKELIKTKQQVSELILETSKEQNISLATPTTHTVDLIQDEQIDNPSMNQ